MDVPILSIARVLKLVIILKMIICFISKYPPLIGGVSTKIFWHSVLLAAADVEVHIVTNALLGSDNYQANFQYPSNIPKKITKKINIHYLAADNKASYIPYADPYVTKLSSIAIDVVKNFKCNLIVGVYFEPNLVAAYITSKFTNVPFGIMNAGSDIGYLLKNSELKTTYANILKSANFIISSSVHLKLFNELGINLNNIFSLPSTLPLKDYFNPYVGKLNFNPELKKDSFYSTTDKLNTIDFKHQVIGVYGKASLYKGQIQLIRALGYLKKYKHLKFNFLIIIQGKAQLLKKIDEEIKVNNIEHETFILPFVNPWEIPSFIKLCNAVCYLEHDFPIEIHGPIIPLEVLSCGTCLILSEDIAKNYRAQLDNSCLIVDPRKQDSLVQALEFVIKNPESCDKKALNAYKEIIEPKQKTILLEAKILKRFYENLINFSNVIYNINALTSSKNILKNTQAIDEHIVNQELDDNYIFINRFFFDRVFSLIFRKIGAHETETIKNLFFKNHNRNISNIIKITTDFGKYLIIYLNNKNKTLKNIAEYELIKFKLLYVKLPCFYSRHSVENVNYSSVNLEVFINKPLIIKHFDYDISKIISSDSLLKKGDKPSIEKSIFLFCPKFRQWDIETYKINFPTKLLLKNIKKPINLLQLKHKMQNILAIQDDSFYEAIDFLSKAQLIGFKYE